MPKSLVLILVLVGILLAVTFAKSLRSPLSQPSRPQAELLSPLEFNELIKDPAVFVLDVHTPEQVHLSETDAFIPDTEVITRLSELPPDKSTPIALYCRSGNMSSGVAKLLLNEGYTRVYDLDGGLDSYKMHVSEVSLTPATQDLGTVTYGEVKTTTLTLTNFTSNPLTVTSLTTSCNCTSAELEERELAPYDSAIITISFDPAVHQDDTDLGQLTRTIYVKTNHPNYQELTASFHALVVKKDQ